MRAFLWSFTFTSFRFVTHFYIRVIIDKKNSLLFNHQRWKPFFFPINLKMKKRLQFLCMIPGCSFVVPESSGFLGNGQPPGRGYEQESQTFFSLLISDSSLELSSTVPTGYFFPSHFRERTSRARVKTIIQIPDKEDVKYGFPMFRM